MAPDDEGCEGRLLSDLERGEKERIAQLESANGLRQFDLVQDVITTFLEPERPFALRPSLIQQLQAVAVKNIDPYPGRWRTGAARITKSKHIPPEAYLVENYVREMCDYINDNWHEKTAFHLSAYVMWRLNWIHPFRDGNGRTSRATSYIVLCTSLKVLLPGSPTIPDQIQEDRTRYFRALEAADEANTRGKLDISQMEDAIRSMLARQLLSVIQQADTLHPA